jgi:hypothetical protein
MIKMHNCDEGPTLFSSENKPIWKRKKKLKKKKKLPRSPVSGEKWNETQLFFFPALDIHLQAYMHARLAMYI